MYVQTTDVGDVVKIVGAKTEATARAVAVAYNSLNSLPCAPKQCDIFGKFVHYF